MRKKSMKRLWVVSLTMLALFVLVSCQNSKSVESLSNSANSIANQHLDEDTLFTEDDVDNAILQIADNVSVIPITVDTVIPDGEVIVSTDTGEEDSLETLLNVNSLSGYVCSIINNPNGKNKWRIQSVKVTNSTETPLGLFAVKQNGRAIQSMGCDAQGNKAVFAMKTSASADYEVFLLDYTGATRQVYQLTLNNKNDIDVSISADGNTIAWQSWIGSDKVITVRYYYPDGSFFDEVLDGSIPYVEPSLDRSGRYIAYLGISNDQTNILKYDIYNGTTTSVLIRSGKRSLAHPSISSDGMRIGWMEGDNDEYLRVKDLNTNAVSDIAVNADLDHGYLADDGSSVVYGINRSDKGFMKVKNVGDGTVKNIYRVISSPARYRGTVWMDSYRWTNISTGHDHSCALTNDNQMYCWGDGFYGQLGYGGTTDQYEPYPVDLPTGVNSWLSVKTGDDYTCALANTYQAYCWGYNNNGQLGDGTTTDKYEPEKVTLPPGLTSWKRIETNGGEHTCAIANNDQAYCWGYNFYGQVGNGTTTNQSTPTAVPLPTGVSSWDSIKAGAYHTCAVADTGQAYCWGYNSDGQLGDGTTTNKSTPEKVSLPPGLTSWKSIRVGGYHSCAIANTNNTYCWGNNGDGQLGDGSTTDRDTPTFVTLPTGVSRFNDIQLGRHHSCAKGNNAELYCWGNNSDGQLGNASTADQSTPTKIFEPAGVTLWRTVKPGGNHSCAIATNDKLYCWGENDDGELGKGDTSDVTVPVSVISPWE